METEEWRFKLIIIGPAGVGKTSLLRRFSENSFSESYKYTTGVDYLSKELKFSEDKNARLTLLDLGGQERFRFLRNSFYEGANGALIVFDLSREQTFEEIKDWIYEMQELAGETIPFILIGNKSDLIDDMGDLIDINQVKTLAEREGSIYIKTSAKTGENVEEAFVELTRRMANIQDPEIVIAVEEKEVLPRNAIQAQGLLIKSFYKKFGKESLPIIRSVLGMQGRSLGLRIKKKLNDTSLTTVAKAFTKSYDPDSVKVISLSDEKFQVQGVGCPFGLENSERELCEAVMAIDLEYFRTAVSDKIKLKIIKTLAAGDSYCDTIYELKND